MKEKKTTIITIRTTERIKEELEEIALQKSWSISQLTEQIIIGYLDPENGIITKNEEESVKKLLNLIEKENTLSYRKIVHIAVNNNLLSTLRSMASFIDPLIKEHNEELQKKGGDRT